MTGACTAGSAPPPDPVTHEAVTRAIDGVARDDDAAFATVMLHALDPMGRDVGLLAAHRRVFASGACRLLRDARGSHVDQDAFAVALARHQASHRATRDAFVATLDPMAVRLMRDPVVGLDLSRRLWEALQPVDGEPSPLARTLLRMPHLGRTVREAWRRDPRPFSGGGPDDLRLRDILVEDLTGRQGLPKALLPIVADGVASLSGWTRDEAVGARRKYRQAPVDADLVVTAAKLLAPFPASWHPRGSRAWSDLFDAFPVLDLVHGNGLFEAGEAGCSTRAAAGGRSSRACAPRRARTTSGAPSATPPTLPAACATRWSCPR